LIFDLYTLEVEANQERNNIEAELAAYTLTIDAEYGALGLAPIPDPTCAVPESSDYCRLETREAHARAVLLKGDIEARKTKNAWIKQKLDVRCTSLKNEYMTLRMLNAGVLDGEQALVNQLLVGLWHFDNDDGS
jgi:hypothetical protein